MSLDVRVVEIRSRQRRVRKHALIYPESLSQQPPQTHSQRTRGSRRPWESNRRRGRMSDEGGQMEPDWGGVIGRMRRLCGNTRPASLRSGLRWARWGLRPLCVDRGQSSSFCCGIWHGCPWRGDPNHLGELSCQERLGIMWCLTPRQSPPRLASAFCPRDSSYRIVTG